MGGEVKLKNVDEGEVSVACGAVCENSKPPTLPQEGEGIGSCVVGAGGDMKVKSPLGKRELRFGMLVDGLATAAGVLECWIRISAICDTPVGGCCRRPAALIELCLRFCAT